MYTILVNNDNSLAITKKERIMQRSKLVDTLCFLVYPIYKEHDMSQFTVLLEYILPVSREYRSDILTLQEDGYKGYLEYRLPFDTLLTSEPGEIELQLSFIYVDLDEDGNSIQYVRKTSTTKIFITPISNWSNIIPDEALTAIDQRIIKTDAQIKELNDISELLDKSKADNIGIFDDSLQLTSNGNKIGDAINLDELEKKQVDVTEDGTVKVIHF